MLAILNGVKLDRKVIAVCEWATYDVWGNDEDGYSVNDVYRQGEIEIPGEVTIDNVPRFPGAKDNYRDFTGKGNSFSCEMMISFSIPDDEIKKALGITCEFEVDGDDTVYYVNKASNCKPLAEIRILSWKECED